MTAVTLLPAGSVRVGDLQVMPPLPPAIFADLRDDIEMRGVRYPVVVTQDLVIVDGHHRWAIAEELGITADVPVIVIQFDSHEEAEAEAIALNIDRRPFTREERDRHIARLRDLGMTQQEVAERLGLSQQRVDQIESDSSLQVTSNEEVDPLETAKAKAKAGSGRGSYRFTSRESQAIQSEIKRLADVGLKQYEIADHIGISFSAVSARLKKTDDPEPGQPLHEELADYALQGMTSRQIAHHMGRTLTWVQRKLRMHDIDVPADKVNGKKTIDTDAAMGRAIEHLNDALYAFKHIPMNDITPEQTETWACSLGQVATDIRTLIREIRNHTKEQTQHDQA